MDIVFRSVNPKNFCPQAIKWYTFMSLIKSLAQSRQWVYESFFYFSVLAFYLFIILCSFHIFISWWDSAIEDIFSLHIEGWPHGCWTQTDLLSTNSKHEEMQWNQVLRSKQPASLIPTLQPHTHHHSHFHFNSNSLSLSIFDHCFQGCTC